MYVCIGAAEHSMTSVTSTQKKIQTFFFLQCTLFNQSLYFPPTVVEENILKRDTAIVAGLHSGQTVHFY